MSSIYLVAKESACTFIAHRLACSQLSCQVHLFIKVICGGERGCTGASLRFCEQMPQVASTAISQAPKRRTRISQVASTTATRKDNGCDASLQVL
jgi:hypothetical protein